MTPSTCPAQADATIQSSSASLGKEISLLQFLNDLVDNDKIWQPAGTWANKWSYLKRPREKIVDVRFKKKIVDQ